MVLLVVLDKNNLTVTKDGPTLKVRHPDLRPRTIPFNMIAQVVVYGKPMVSCDVWRALAEHGIPAILFPGRGKGEPAFMGAGLASSAQVRDAQHKASANSFARAAVGRRLLRMKLSACMKLIDAIATGAEDKTFETSFAAVDEAAEKARAVVRKSRDALASASERDVLMGHEGAASAAWFEFLALVLPEKWRFSRRNRRPPQDPVNALLSLSYTMAEGEALRAIQQRGLDPFIGLLHELRPGRRSLALDILEPLRPCVDALVVKMLDTELNPRHFTYGKQEGCRLNKEARRIYYTSWGKSREDWPWRLLADSPKEIATGMPDACNVADDGSETEQTNPDTERDMGVNTCCRWIVKNVIDAWEQNG